MWTDSRKVFGRSAHDDAAVAADARVPPTFAVAMLADAILTVAARTALAVLAIFYCQAALRGDLWSNRSWTISTVMVYGYNDTLTKYVLFPAFLSICVAYSLKLNVRRIIMGLIVASVGGVGLIAYPVTTNPFGHNVFTMVSKFS